MRLFVALTPSPAAVQHLHAAIAEVSPLTGLRWPPPEAWHITLAFLGEVEDRRRAEVERRLARAAARHPPLWLRLAGAGTFGSRRRARILWSGVELVQAAPAAAVGQSAPGQGTDSLTKLAKSVLAAARRSGIEVSDRFRAHVTVARARQPTDLSVQVDQLATYAGQPWLADRVELIHSRLRQGPGGGAAYDTVSTFPLVG